MGALALAFHTSSGARTAVDTAIAMRLAAPSAKRQRLDMLVAGGMHRKMGGVMGAFFRPGVEVVDVIDDVVTVAAKARSATGDTKFFQSLARQSEIMRRL